MMETFVSVCPMADSLNNRAEKSTSVISNVPVKDSTTDPTNLDLTGGLGGDTNVSQALPKRLGLLETLDNSHIQQRVPVPSTQWGVISPLIGENLNLRYQQIPVRDPEQGEVIVRIAWTGICRSDVTFSKGPYSGFPKCNHIAGHEGIGHVVKSADPSRIGRPVGIRYIGYTCGFCTYCRSNLPEQCAKQMNAPKHYNGTFQQFMTVPWSCLVPLPEWIFDSHGQVSPATYTTAMCSGAAALKAIRTANVGVGDVIVINGIAGGIGHMAGQIAKHVFGAKVVGVDLAWKIDSLISDQSQSFYDRIVAAPDSKGDQTSPKFFEALEELCSDLRGSSADTRLADVVINCASTAQGFAGFENIARDGGVIVYCGVPRGELEIPISLHNLIERQLTIRGTLMGGPEATYEVMQYIREGRIKPITREIDLDEVPEGMQDLLRCKGIGKLVVKVNGQLPSGEEF